MQSPMLPVLNKTKTSFGDLLSNLSVNDAHRRRLAGAQDPSLLFGTAVFSQMVAADLVRDSNAAVEELVGEESGADADQTESLVSEETEGLFGALAGTASGFVPIAGAGAVLATAPGSGSDAASVLGSGSSGNAAEEQPQGDTGSQNSVVSRNFSSLRNGGSPSADGAQQANPEQEAAGAQTTAADTQQQFTGAGGANPFVAPTPDTPTSIPQAQTAADTPTAPSASVAQADSVAPTDAPTRVNSGEDIPLSMEYSTAVISSQAMPEAGDVLGVRVPELLVV